MSSKKIWPVLLADSPPEAGSQNNCTRIIRTSVFEGGVALSASGLCRKVVEASGEWLLKICQRHPAAAPRDNTNTKACIVVNYGCGFATLVLMNGAELSGEGLSDHSWKAHPAIWVTVAVASVKSEVAGISSDERLQDYGIVSTGDASKFSCNEDAILCCCDERGTFLTIFWLLLQSTITWSSCRTSTRKQSECICIQL
jgi:hypothetical protein